MVQFTPTYMMWDDHEIMDGWGGEFAAGPEREDLLERFANAEMAYRTFQQAHNPPGLGETKKDYSFRWGPCAFYVADLRTFRGKDPEFPIVGKEQFDRITAWAMGNEILDADIVFFVATVPIAFAPVEEIKKLIQKAEDLAEEAGGGLGVVGGAGIGGALAGPLGAIIGAEIGYYIGAAVGTELFEKELSKYDLTDLADQWTTAFNRPDLLNVLETLFKIGIDAGWQLRNRPQRKRAVFVLGGDVHVGGMHVITSEKRVEGNPDRLLHEENRHIIQIIGSPISRTPPNSEIYEDFLEHYQGGVTLIDAAKAGLGLEEDPAHFWLDGPPRADRHPPGDYRATGGALLLDRNYGRITVEKLGAPEDRHYRVRMAVEGDTGWIRHDVEFDLNEAFVEPLLATDSEYQVVTKSPSVSERRGPPSRRT